ncbi:MAG: hypothetical protein HY656_06525 [Acidobacteria bacterium]|nr:hypothetical protein [Acidobacteriota bacterium]
MRGEARRAASLLCSLAVAGGCLLEGQAPTAELIATLTTGEDLPVVAAWSPDSQRLAYGVEKEVVLRRRPLSAEEEAARVYPGEVWVSNLQTKPKLILRHDFLRNREGYFFSFSVERLAWSPDGAKIAVEVTDERKNTATFLLTAEGKRVELGDTRQNFIPGYGAGWLEDSQSLGVLAEAVEPRLLHRVGVVRVAAGRMVSLFEASTFAAVAWLPRARKLVGIERDPDFSGAPLLVVGDLESGDLRTLAKLEEGYLGGLQTSPDETRISYFVGQEKLAVRGLAPEAPVEYWPIPFSRYAWAGTSGALLYIEPEALGQRTGWLARYEPATGNKQRVVTEEKIQDFWVAPDGERVAVLTVGLKPILGVYRLPASAR